MYKNFLLILCSVIVSLVLLEFGLRLLMRQISDQADPVATERHVYDPFCGHALNPAFHTRSNTLGRMIHSPDGFRRDRPVSQEKPAQLIRVLMLGGSALYGIGTSGQHYPYAPDLMNNETIPFYLEQLLNERLTGLGLPQRVEVLNCGLVAYQTWQHLVHLNARLLAYHPDIVINFDGHNDFYETNPARNHWYDYPYSSVQLTKALNKRLALPGLHFLVRALAQYSAIFAQIEKRVTLPRLEAQLQALVPAATLDVGDPATLEARFKATARSGFLRALWQINRLGLYEHYEHMVFLQPEILLEDPENLHENDRRVREITVGFMDNADLMRRIRPLLPGLFAEAGIPYEDVGDIARQAGTGEPLYIDYCHLLPRGSLAVAHRLLDPVWNLVQGRLTP